MKHLVHYCYRKENRANYNNDMRVLLTIALREKCPDTELFLVRIFLYSNQK